mmetsp:Transcript_22649/g.28575  ORF Transcript_22649/g.28575 Transcript_22649/m.28575 type:complete len:523 (-) Transcript_22649:130-1698(-)|eukprot:CAMPEP_0203678124 /NCGR_PEP_ID=MMETSP0090-20130426/30801_1 /ASSEMBLY_ACC=CAM_ASM_001088 /TAXON_ID=426623 /ORGANISM="Chaetoceros affinis, Strain CCMP159" /LENGTH=522 /DNA_ID=CAMNT_0050545233 /DNA_START=123 /DNA_END=1691 /DNA_ORIENTATION=-
MRVQTSAVVKADSEDDDELPMFRPLDSKFSYAATPKSFEVIPTKCIKDVIGSLDASQKHQKNYGAPDDSINTRHVSGKKIDKKHEQYALSAGMMLGVRECVGGMSDLASADFSDNGKKQILEEECLKVEKLRIPAGAYFVSSKMASLPYRYKFKAYAPVIFHRIRDMAGVDKQRFLHSVCGSDNFIEFISNAKSGQFFFYSHDGRYMIKTQTQEEKSFLRRILPDYYSHLKHNPHSFITHFYGMYRVKIPDLGKSIHFVIMKSVFNTELEIHKIWDLKGSTLGRRAKRGDSVHKDLDIMDEGRKISVGAETKEGIMNQLKNDAEFLSKMHIMDYSLLLGVHLQTAISERKSAILTRTNTPMRRKKFFESEQNETVIQHFMNGAKSIFNKSHGSSTGNDTPLTNNSYEDESDDSDGETDDADVSTIGELETVLTFFDAPKYREMIPPNPYSAREDLGIESKSSGDIKEVYFAGIIDILQLYNARKWGETMMRKTIGAAEKDISCVSPEVYADRFVKFFDALLE